MCVSTCGLVNGLVPPHWDERLPARAAEDLDHPGAPDYFGYSASIGPSPERRRFTGFRCYH